MTVQTDKTAPGARHGMERKNAATCLSRNLNLGCGQFPIDQYLNVDVDALSKADKLLDLNNPKSYEQLPAEYFELVRMDHVLEHLDKPFEVLRSVYTLMRPGARLEIRVPHFSRGMTHAEHSHCFDVTFPQYFNPDFRGGYVGVPLELESMRLDYMIRWDLKRPLLPRWQIVPLKGMNLVMTWLANLQPLACSRFWCHLVGGFEQIEFIFRKPQGPTLDGPDSF